MIWFFLAGFISGVVGTLKFANWYVRRNTIYVQKVDDDTAHSADDDNGSEQSGRG